MEQFTEISVPALVWGSIAFTLIAAFGCTAMEKLKAINSKYSMIRWTDYEVEIVFAETEEASDEPHEESLSLGGMEGWEMMNPLTISYYE